MIVASAQLNVGLIATAANTRTNVTGLNYIGLPNTTFDFSGITKAYALEITAASASEFHFDTHAFTAAAYTAGTKQIETATGLGTITTSGDVTVVITSGYYGNDTFNVALALGDTPALWLPKIKAVLSAATGAASNFTWSNTSSTLVSVNKFASANDSTLNISISNGTCAGISNTLTSANTAAGVSSSGGFLTDLSVLDFEGRLLPASTKVKALLVQCVSGKVYWRSTGTGDMLQLSAGGFVLIGSGVSGDALKILDGYAFTPFLGYEGSVVRVTSFES